MNKAELKAKEIFDRYVTNEKLNQVNIFHLYDTGNLGLDNDGFHDSRFAKVIGFNTITMEKRDFGDRDGIESYLSNANVELIRIFIDGSFLIKFKFLVNVEVFQCLSIL